MTHFRHRGVVVVCDMHIAYMVVFDCVEVNHVVRIQIWGRGIFWDSVPKFYPGERMASQPRYFCHRGVVVVWDMQILIWYCLTVYRSTLE